MKTQQKQQRSKIYQYIAKNWCEYWQRNQILHFKKKLHGTSSKSIFVCGK